MNPQDFFRLDGRTILVTGASSGLGQAISIACSSAGAKVLLSGRDLSRLEETESLLEGHGHRIFPADLMDPDAVRSLADDCPPLNGVVFSAGVHGAIPVRMLSQDALARIHQVNYFAPVMLAQRLLQQKKVLNDSSLLFISSIAALTGKVGVAAYSGSKAALGGTMRTLALEVAKFGTRVNCLCPGIVRTPLFEGQEEWLSQEVALSYPLGLGEPQDVAHAAVFFLSPASKNITGVEFNIDGGVPFT